MNRKNLKDWMKALTGLRAAVETAADSEEVERDYSRAADRIVDAFTHVETRLRNIEESLAAIRADYTTLHAQNAKLLARVKRRSKGK